MESRVHEIPLVQTTWNCGIAQGSGGTYNAQNPINHVLDRKAPNSKSYHFNQCSPGRYEGSQTVSCLQLYHWWMIGQGYTLKCLLYLQVLMNLKLLNSLRISPQDTHNNSSRNSIPSKKLPPPSPQLCSIQQAVV